MKDLKRFLFVDDEAMVVDNEQDLQRVLLEWIAPQQVEKNSSNRLETPFGLNCRYPQSI
jgi:hypothetical protein